MILFLSVFPPYRGGISKFSRYLADSLNSTELCKTVNYSRQYPSILFPGTTQFDKENNWKSDYTQFHPYQPFNWKTTADFICDENPDFFIFSNWHPFFIPSHLSVLKRLKKKKPELKRVGIFHNVFPHEPFPLQKKWLKYLFKQTDLAVFLSQSTTDEFNSLKVDTSYQTLFHPIYPREIPTDGVERLREKWSIPKEKRILLFFGLIRQYKGLDNLLKALKQTEFHKKDFHLIIAGEFYESKDLYLNLLDNNEMKSVTVIDRYTSEKEAAELFKLSDLLILPYRSASQSGITADAIYAELPILASDLPGISQYINDGEHGLLVEPNSVESLVSALERLSDESLERQRIALRDLSKSLSWELFITQLISKIKG